MPAAFHDGEILRTLGLMLARDEAGTARPVAVAADHTPIVFRRCGWCGVGLGVKPAGCESSAGFISDGMCPECFARVSARYQRQEAAA